MRFKIENHEIIREATADAGHSRAVAAKWANPVGICKRETDIPKQAPVLDTICPRKPAGKFYSIEFTLGEYLDHPIPQWGGTSIATANTGVHSAGLDIHIATMFSLHSARYFLYSRPTDMRKSFDGLSGLVVSRLGQNPMSGDVFIFINRSRNRIKLLRWESGGFVLFYKRLEKGTFEVSFLEEGQKSPTLSYGELAMLITGISMKNARKKRRFLQQKPVGK